RDVFTPAQRTQEGFSVHADADEHSRVLSLRPDLVAADLAAAPPIIGHDIADLRKIASPDSWTGYFGVPAIANAGAGSRAMDAIAKVASAVVLKVIEGGSIDSAPRVTDELIADPDVKRMVDGALARERAVEQRESNWIAKHPH